MTRRLEFRIIQSYTLQLKTGEHVRGFLPAQTEAQSHPQLSDRLVDVEHTIETQLMKNEFIERKFTLVGMKRERLTELSVCSCVLITFIVSLFCFLSLNHHFYSHK